MEGSMQKKLSSIIMLYSVLLGYGLISSYAQQVKPPRPQPKLPEFGTTYSLEIFGITPRQISPGQRITVGYYLQCNTKLGVSSVRIRVGLFLGTDLRQTNNIDLNVNQRIRLFISADAPSEPGSYTASLKVVPADVNPAAASGDQILAMKSQSFQVLLLQAFPDLTIENFSVTGADTRTVGGITFAYFPFTARIKNVGGASANAFAVGIFEGDVGLQVVEGGATVAPLPAGQSVQVSGAARQTIRPGTSQDTYQLRAKADVPVGEFIGSQGVIRELNEANNISAVVNVRFETVNILGNYSAYRGNEIEIQGSFGSSFSGKKIALDRQGGFAGLAELVSFSPTKLVIRIPKTGGVVAGQNHRIFIVEEGYPGTGKRRLSNFADLRIFNPIAITSLVSQCAVTFSPTGTYPPNILVKGIATDVGITADNLTNIRIAVSRGANPADSAYMERYVPGYRIHPSVYKAVPPGPAQLIAADFREAAYRTGDSEGVARLAVEVRRDRNAATRRREIGVAQGGVPSFGIYMAVHIDKAGSYLDMTVMGFLQPRHTFPQELAEFVERFAGRDILHQFQDINGQNGFERQRGTYAILNGRIILPVIMECGGPIEIKRSAKVAGSWDDNLAYDVNLRSLSFRVSFGSGYPQAALNMGNIIHDVDVEIDLDADVSNMPDGLELLNLVDNRMKRILRAALQQTFSSPDLKSQFINAVLGQVKNFVGETTVIVNAWLAGETLFVDYLD
jgi:hypothetical protein